MMALATQLVRFWARLSRLCIPLLASHCGVAHTRNLTRSPILACQALRRSLRHMRDDGQAAVLGPAVCLCALLGLSIAATPFAPRRSIHIAAFRSTLDTSLLLPCSVGGPTSALLMDALPQVVPEALSMPGSLVDDHDLASAIAGELRRSTRFSVTDSFDRADYVLFVEGIYAAMHWPQATDRLRELGCRQGSQGPCHRADPRSGRDATLPLRTRLLLGTP